MGDKIDALIIDYVALMERIGALEESEQEDFIEQIDSLTNQNNMPYDDGMEVLYSYFTGEE